MKVVVTLSDGTDLQARVLGEDPTTDIAVLKVDRTDLPVAPMGRSTDLMIGEWVVALGNPFAYLLGNTEPSVTAGVVSATGRNILPNDNQAGLYLDMIQTDAAINPGNSGGPLANALGEVIGVNSSIFTQGGGSIGLGFAIPIERALRVADEVIRTGEVHRAWVGLEVAGRGEHAGLEDPGRRDGHPGGARRPGRRGRHPPTGHPDARPTAGGCGTSSTGRRSSSTCTSGDSVRVKVRQGGPHQRPAGRERRPAHGHGRQGERPQGHPADHGDAGGPGRTGPAERPGRADLPYLAGDRQRHRPAGGRRHPRRQPDDHPARRSRSGEIFNELRPRQAVRVHLERNGAYAFTDLVFR